MEFLLVAICIGTIPGFIAQSKGRSFVAWWLYGAALFIVALPHSLLIKPDVKQIEREQTQSGNARKCPFCAEIIKAEANVCRYCGRDLPNQVTPGQRAGVGGPLIKCGRCNSHVPDTAQFCSACGCPMSPATAIEDRQRISAEEKARIEARDRIKAEPRSFWTGYSPVVIAIVGLIVLVILLSQFLNKPDRLSVSRADFGEAWPLTVEEGVLTCEKNYAVVLLADGKRYAVNGMAKTWQLGESINSIWRDDPGSIAQLPDGSTRYMLKVNISPILDLGVQLCDSVRDGRPLPKVPISQPSVPRTPTVSDAEIKALATKRTKTRGTAFFATPVNLCGLLSEDGFQSGGWAQGRYPPTAFCDVSPLDPASPFEYIVQGWSHRAEEIKLELNVDDDDSTKGALKRTMMNLTKHLFSGLGVPVPAGLLEAVRSERAFHAEQQYGAVVLGVRKLKRLGWPDPAESGKPCTFFELRIWDSVAERAEKREYAEQYEQCRSKVAEDLGVSAKDLVGDGKPNHLPDGTFFDLKLNDNSQLCHVYPDGTYTRTDTKSGRQSLRRPL